MKVPVNSRGDGRTQGTSISSPVEFCKVQLGSDQTIATNGPPISVLTLVASWNTVIEDTHGSWSSGAKDRLTFQVSGKKQMFLHHYWEEVDAEAFSERTGAILVYDAGGVGQLAADLDTCPNIFCTTAISYYPVRDEGHGNSIAIEVQAGWYAQVVVNQNSVGDRELRARSTFGFYALPT